jgi:hypothetical protein
LYSKKVPICHTSHQPWTHLKMSKETKPATKGFQRVKKEYSQNCRSSALLDATEFWEMHTIDVL